MFLKDTHDSDGPLDFRPAIHDSGGLAAWNSRDERLWRPLRQPARAADQLLPRQQPKGLRTHSARKTVRRLSGSRSALSGSAQRLGRTHGQLGRRVRAARRDPDQAEYFDNIVAFWRPDDPLLAGQAYSIDYRLSWCDDVPAWNGYRVGKTRIGVGSRPETVRFVVDFLDWRSSKLEQVASVGITDVPLRPLPEAVISASAGRHRQSSRAAQPRHRRHSGDVRVRSARSQGERAAPRLGCQRGAGVGGLALPLAPIVAIARLTVSQPASWFGSALCSIRISTGRVPDVQLAILPSQRAPIQPARMRKMRPWRRQEEAARRPRIARQG